MRRYGIAAAGAGLLGALALLAVLVLEALKAWTEGDPDEVVEPPRAAQRFGADGPELTYVVIGDSTAAGQGAGAVEGSIAWETARALARGRRVTMTNLADSGAVAGDVVSDQLAGAEELAPGLVLLAVGANDVTHLVGRR